MNYITHAAIADAMGWPQTELRVLRRLTRSRLHPCRAHGPGAPTRANLFAVEHVLAWLSKIMDRLDPAAELRIRESAISLGGANQ